MIDTRVNQMYDNNDPQPYDPTATMANLDWGDAWDAADAYGHVPQLATAEVVVKPFGRILAVASLCIAVAACASNAKLKEDMLSASGFKATPPKTPGTDSVVQQPSAAQAHEDDP